MHSCSSRPCGTPPPSNTPWIRRGPAAARTSTSPVVLPKRRRWPARQTRAAAGSSRDTRRTMSPTPRPARRAWHSTHFPIRSPGTVTGRRQDAAARTRCSSPRRSTSRRSDRVRRNRARACRSREWSSCDRVPIVWWSSRNRRARRSRWRATSCV